MPGSPDRPDGAWRRARFTVPPPSNAVHSVADRLRLVDPTGNAVAWLGYGKVLVVLGFFVQDGETWREVLRDRPVAVDGRASTWTLIERDPTMARLRCEADGHTIELFAEIADGTLAIRVDDGRNARNLVFSAME
ncbi:MAG: hypothetical protein QM589_07700 [Thermomicrobiales bacterium]